MAADPGRARLRAGLALAGCALIGAFVLRGERVPLLSLVNLGFHELGHLVTYPLPDLVTAVMGSVTQTLVPLGLAAYFVWGHRDVAGVALCLAWAGSNAQEWSVYMADAPFERLELLGDGEHDWAFALDRLGWMEAADELAATLVALSWALVVAGAAVSVWAALHPERERDVAAPTTVISARPISWD